MHIFRRPDNHSEVSQFLDQLKADHPDMQEQQRSGRELLWDKQVDRQAWAEFEAARVAQKPYVYQSGQ